MYDPTAGIYVRLWVHWKYFTAYSLLLFISQKLSGQQA
jgi:hypothetical protein